MKTFKDFLTESKKTYPFKIGIAGEIPEGFNERLKLALDKFVVTKLSPGKTTPIQKRPLDFPQFENMEVTYWETELQYPTTDAILREYLGQVCTVHVSHIVVNNPNSPLEKAQESQPDSEVYDPLLTKSDIGGESAQQSVGATRVMDLLKELETARKERGDQDGFKMEASKAEPQNTKSAIGS